MRTQGKLKRCLDLFFIFSFNVYFINTIFLVSTKSPVSSENATFSVRYRMNIARESRKSLYYNTVGGETGILKYFLL